MASQTGNEDTSTQQPSPDSEVPTQTLSRMLEPHQYRMDVEQDTDDKQWRAKCYSLLLPQQVEIGSGVNQKKQLAKEEAAQEAIETLCSYGWKLPSPPNPGNRR
ncbi:hypothetical protein FRC17_001564 [Serendipita sp. 399]|nr:hypothetical protein FRC17_001564 [Serendipita sp. 399]